MCGTFKKSAKILQFPTRIEHPAGLSHDDAEIVETIMQVMSGSEVPITEVEFTERSLVDIEKNLGKPSSESGAWTFPTRCWSMTDSRGSHGNLVVVDVGAKRAMYFHQRKEAGSK